MMGNSSGYEVGNSYTDHCHTERSEASRCPARQTLRGVYTECNECAQGDRNARINVVYRLGEKL